MLWLAGAAAVVYLVIKGNNTKQEKLVLDSIAEGLKMQGWSDANIATVQAGMLTLPADQFDTLAVYLLQYHFTGKAAPPELMAAVSAILNPATWWPH